MTSSPTDSGGRPPCANLKARRSIRYAVMDAAAVALVELPDGRDLIWTRDYWDELRELEMSPNYSMRSNGSGKQYAHCHTTCPPISSIEPPTHEAARLVLALAELREQDREAAGLERTRPRLPYSWQVRFLNGNHLDLRIENLHAVPSERRTRRHTIEDLRQRRAWVREGKSPNREHAAKRCAARSANKKAGE